MARLELWLTLVSLVLILNSQSGFCQSVNNFTCPQTGGRNFYLDDYFSSSSYLTFNIFSDPYNSGSYQDNSNCKVQFVSGRTPLNVYVTFKKLDLEYSGTCSYDSICALNVKWCGARIQEETYNSVVPAYNTLTVLFTSDSSVIRPGFQIEVKIFPTTPDATASQPAVPYASAQFSVSNFETKNQSDYVDRCNNDNSIYNDGYTTNYPWESGSSSLDSESTTNYPWASESTNLPWNVYESSITPNGQVEYTLDYEYQSSTSSSYETYPSYSYDPQYLDITADNTDTTFSLDAIFQLGRYVVVNISSESTNAGHYYDNTNFSVHFATRNIPAIIYVAFQQMDIETSSSCSKDYICAGGIRWCGQRTQAEWYSWVLPVNNQFTVRFTSDSYATRPGFFLQAYFHRATNDTTSYSPTGSYESQQWSVHGFETLTMDGYTDKCLSSSVTIEEDTTPTYTYHGYADNDYYLSTRAPWDGDSGTLEGEIRELQEEIQEAQDRLDRANYLATDIQRQVNDN